MILLTPKPPTLQLINQRQEDSKFLNVTYAKRTSDVDMFKNTVKYTSIHILMTPIYQRHTHRAETALFVRHNFDVIKMFARQCGNKFCSL
jgi:hypothetical protein